MQAVLPAAPSPSANAKWTVSRDKDGTVKPADLEDAIVSATGGLSRQLHVALWNRMGRRVQSRECPPLLKEKWHAAGKDTGRTLTTAP